MVGDKIRAYREFKGLNQIQLSKACGINVSTIRKYELGLRNPKPDQLEKIANALGLNVSVFLDFNIETVGDVLSLLFAIDDSVELQLTDHGSDGINIKFKNGFMQEFIQKWCEFKAAYDKNFAEISEIQDEEKRNEELAKLEKIKEEWQYKAMATTIGCHTIVKKGDNAIRVKLYDWL